MWLCHDEYFAGLFLGFASVSKTGKSERNNGFIREFGILLKSLIRKLTNKKNVISVLWNLYSSYKETPEQLELNQLLTALRTEWNRCPINYLNLSVLLSVQTLEWSAHWFPISRVNDLSCTNGTLSVSVRRYSVYRIRLIKGNNGQSEVGDSDGWWLEIWPLTRQWKTLLSITTLHMMSQHVCEELSKLPTTNYLFSYFYFHFW